MNRLLRLVLASTIVLTTVAPLFAQQPDAAIHDELRRLKATMTKALNERDIDAIVANVDPNVVFTTMNGDVCKGPQQIRAYFDKMLNAPGHIVKDVKVSFEADALTTLYGGTTGVAYGSSKDHYVLTNGQAFDISGRWTCTMVKSGDRWVIAAFHYSANVFDNPILAKLRTMATSAAVAAAVLGLIVGLLIGRRMRRA